MTGVMTNSFLSSGLFGDLCRDPEIAAQFSAAAFTARMIRFEIAWTEALIATGAVSCAQGKLALDHLNVFAPDLDMIGAGSGRDGLPVPALVAAMKIGAPQGSIHAGATSQDVIDTAMVLTLRDGLDVMGARLDRVCTALDRLKTRHGAAPLMGRTRMQAALPISAGQRIDAWLLPLKAQAEHRLEVLQSISQVQIGGAVGDRAQPDMAAHVAQNLGLRLGPVWHTDRTPMVQVGHWCSTLSGSLGKIAQDITLMAQQGIEEVALDGSGGSSAMPHKQNPIKAETIVALARYGAHMQGLLGQAMIHEQERSGTAWTLEWMSLPSIVEATGAALRLTGDLLDQITRIGDPPR